MSLAPGLLALLACPKCHGTLEERKDSLRCKACAKDYRVDDGIPDFV